MGTVQWIFTNGYACITYSLVRIWIIVITLEGSCVSLPDQSVPHLHGQCSGFHHHRLVFSLPRFHENGIHTVWTLVSAYLLTLSR